MARPWRYLRHLSLGCVLPRGVLGFEHGGLAHLLLAWKHLAIWSGNVAQFNESSTYLMGWFRDYLWLNSSQLINGYNPVWQQQPGRWSWMFLFGHLVWATGFMFLISWRGYWQELIETIVWAHQRSPIANMMGWRDKPVALSIVQARVVGLAHFSVGYVLTYAAFLIASTSGKFG